MFLSWFFLHSFSIFGKGPDGPIPEVSRSNVFLSFFLSCSFLFLLLLLFLWQEASLDNIAISQFENNWLSWQIMSVSDDKIQITLLILGRSALSRPASQIPEASRFFLHFLSCSYILDFCYILNFCFSYSSATSQHSDTKHAKNASVLILIILAWI